MCIDRTHRLVTRNQPVRYVMAENGSTGGSQDIARAHRTRVVPVVERGYGIALPGGIQAARGRYVIVGNADNSYDFSRLNDFIKKPLAGYGLVMDNRGDTLTHP